MKGLPVTVRLLDPPLHEFLPNLVEQSLKVLLHGQDLVDGGLTLLRGVRGDHLVHGR
jgi:phosphoenolpyruvate synthase/pyruvate phosphate dikinase